MIYKGYFNNKNALVKSAKLAESALDIMDIVEKLDNPYLTPEFLIPLSPALLFAVIIGEEYYEDSEEAEILTTWKAAFNAGCLV